MQEEAVKDGKTDERELWKACNKLWIENVRQDLIYSSKLALCKSCVTFFYSNSDNDHPKEHVVNVHAYFIANDITSLTKMMDYFRPAWKSTKIADFGQGQVTLPIISTIHRTVNASGFSQVIGNPFDRVTVLCRDTTQQMMEVVDQQNKAICDLRCEVEELRSQNEELLLKMVKLQAKTSSDKRALARLANHMLIYCEECSCEGGQCEHSTGDSYSENKAK